MTDFYALLKQSILDRGIRSAKEREGIYAQARRAVIKQLWDYRPPLAAHEIDSRVGAYDTAVERIEADLQLAFADSKALAAARRSELPSALTEPERTSDDDLPPFTDWLMDEPEYERGIERSSAYAPPATRQPKPPATREPAPPEPEPEPYYEEEAQPLAYDSGDDEESGDAEPPPRRGGDRWSEPEPEERAPGVMASLSGWLGTGEQLKIRLLAAAIGVLFIALVGIGAYFLGARNNNPSVTLGIGVRREVSDAATAARIPTDSATVAQTYAIFDGRDPTVFSTTPDDPIHFDSTAGVARIASSASASGAKVVIGPGLAARLAGQRVHRQRRRQHALCLPERPCHQPLADRQPRCEFRVRRDGVAAADHADQPDRRLPADRAGRSRRRQRRRYPVHQNRRAGVVAASLTARPDTQPGAAAR